MSTSQSTIDGTAADRLNRRLKSVRDALVDSGRYLGEPENALLGMVSWKRAERGYRLVMKKSENEGQESFEGVMDDAATFCVVVQISHDNCWLTPCGYWKGPNQVTQKFEDLKLTFQGERSVEGGDVFGEDHEHVINNVRALIERQVDDIGDRNASVKGFLNSRPGPQMPVLKFRHVLFEVINNDTSDTASESDDIVDEITLADWPVVHPEAEHAKQEMLTSHRVVALPAYDVDGKLIQPKRYKEALAGALVRIDFNLSHWYINAHGGREASNSFVADVSAIRVLVEPMTSKVPSKRKTGKRDPGIGSLSSVKRKKASL